MMRYEGTAPTVLAAREHAVRVAPEIERWNRERRFPREAFLDAGHRGLCSLYVPLEQGGQGVPILQAAQVFEELGRADGLYALAMSVHNFATRAVATAGSSAMRGRWAGPMSRGESIGAFLMTEESGGSDPAGTMVTRAVVDGDGYRLCGKKSWACFAGEAEVYAVVCRTGQAERGTRDMMMVLVQADDPGVHISRVYDKSTGGFLPIGDVEFDDVRLDPDRVLAPAGAGFKAALSTIDIARVNVAAGCVGLASAALEIALRETSKRSLFGSTVLELQANLFALADVKTSIEAGRLLYQHAAGLIGQPGGSVAAAHAKRFCPDAAVQATITCTRVMGANGSLNDHPMPRLLADAQYLTMADGATAVQRLVIGRDLIAQATRHQADGANQRINDALGADDAQPEPGDEEGDYSEPAA